MNFLAHYVLATRLLPVAVPLSAYVVGTALPDLLPLAANRVRLRPVPLAQAFVDTDFESALASGVSVHLATDTAFHRTQAFAEAQAETGSILARTAFEGIRVRRFFVAHVLVEMALDAVLLRSDPAIADGFYTAFIDTDMLAVTRWTEGAVKWPLPCLPDVLERFARSQYLRHYAEDDGVATGLSRLCGRAHQDIFEGENYARLIDVVGKTIARLPKYVPLLLLETLAGISLP